MVVSVSKRSLKSEQKELDGRNKDRNTIKVEKQFGKEDKESSAKRMKLSGDSKDDNDRKDGIVNMSICIYTSYIFHSYKLLHKLSMCYFFYDELKQMKGKVQVQSFLRIVIWN